MNELFIDGHLTKDPEIEGVGNGKSVMKFTIGNNKRWKQGNEWKSYTSFIDITFWPDDPSYWAKRLYKGTGVMLKAELNQDRWEQDGKQRSALKVKALSIMVKEKSPLPSTQTPEQQQNFNDDIPF